MPASSPVATQLSIRPFWRSWWLAPLLVGLASRVWVIAWLLTGFANHLQPVAPYINQGPWVIWDSVWYVGIAKNGYHSTPFGGGYYDFAFFPGWPILNRLLSLNGLLPINVIAPLMGNLLFLAACPLLFRFFSERFDRGALTAVALSAFAPASYVYSIAYSEPLFLILGVLFFLSATTSRWRPVLAALDQTVRPIGVALSMSALPRVWRSRGRDRLAWVTLLVAPVVFLAWCGYIALLTGQLTGYMLGTPSWGTPSSSPRGLASLVNLLAMADLRTAVVLPALIMALGFIGYGMWHFLRRRDYELTLFVLTLALPSLFLADVSSMPRYMLVAFPVFGALAARLDRRWLWLILIGCALVDGLGATLAGLGVSSP
jgi:hypothetical protein